MTYFRRFTILTLLLFLAACNSDSKKGTTVSDSGVSDADTSTTQVPSEPKIPPGQEFGAGGDYAASHILIGFVGAQRVKPDVTRTKEEAKVKAEQLITRLNEDPGLFLELAKMESDGPSGPNGGSLGVFLKGAMVKPFEDALAALSTDGISQAPVETDFGYHIIRRDSLKKAFWAGDAFIVAFKSPNTPPNIERDKAAAQVLADEIKAKINADNFVELAKAHNDFQPGGPMFLGPFSVDNAPSAEIIDGLKGIDFGQVTGYIELPVGFAFIRRQSVEQRAGSHILIGYKGARNANPTVTRTKEEAYARAQELIAELQSNVSAFPDYAKEHSDGPSAQNGGSLGTWFKGKMVPAFEKALDTMAVDTITTECVETDFGYHIIRKEQPKN